ncbi:MAG TPA: ABC transporter permease [Tissierellia bacterium]|nr:ABC transporter permease [Tissierellia bacterium]
MTVFKYFLKIAIKNRWIIIMYVTIFFVMTVLNSNDAVKREESFVESKLNIGIIDNCNSELSNSLKDYLKDENNIVDTVEDEDYIKEQIFLEVADAVVIIPEDFDEKVIRREESVLVYKDDRKPQSIQIENQINKFLAFANITYENGNFALKDVAEALNESVEVHVLPSGEIEGSGINTWFKFYFNFTGYVTIALYIAVIGVVMSDFRDENIDSRRRISSKRFLEFNREIYLGQLTLASAVTITFIIASIIFMRENIWNVYFLKYVVNLIVFSFSILCLTFLINNITRNKHAITALSTVLSLGTSFISGVMVPQEILGDKVLAVAKFFPTYYFVRVNESMINSLSDIGFDIFMQLLFAVAFLLLGLIFSRKDLLVQ